MKSPWKFVGASGEGSPFEIEGVKVWAHDWIAEKEVPRAEVKDPHYGQLFSFRVYRVEVGAKKIRFAAGEFSNSVFGFFVPDVKRPNQSLQHNAIAGHFSVCDRHSSRG